MRRAWLHQLQIPGCGLAQKIKLRAQLCAVQQLSWIDLHAPRGSTDNISCCTDITYSKHRM